MASKPPFAAGAQVEHSKFGPGSVIACTDQHITIKFDESGERKFVLEIALPAIRKIDRQPPETKKRSVKKTKAVAVAAAAEKSEFSSAKAAHPCYRRWVAAFLSLVI